jgi:hypothetical protein
MDVLERLPDADALFLQYFDRWYPRAAKERRIHPATRPEMEAFPELIGRSATELCTLKTDAAQIELAQVDRMVSAASKDWPLYLAVTMPVDLRWVEAFDAYYNEERVKALLDSSPANQFGNNYVAIACEFGAVLGHVLKQSVPRLEWAVNEPYWESALLDPKTGNLIPVFHWAIKKLSRYGIDDGFAAKLRACTVVLERGAAV